MCGFIINIANKGYNDNFIKRRGQDYSTFFAHKNLEFRHYLLHITGVLTHQPFFNSDKSIVCLYNGEIYNQKFENSDGEVIIPLYEKYDLHFIEHLDGEFAIALYDFNRNIAIFVTDRFATKPIYRSGYECASYESGIGGKKIDAATMEIVNINSGELILRHKYHNFIFSNQKNNSYDSCITSFENSIKKRAKNGCFIGLSSGYDSGAICCELLKQNVNFKAYSIKASENINILTKRLQMLREYILINSFDIELEKEFLNVCAETFDYKIVRDGNYKLESYKNDYASLALSFICRTAKSEHRKVYLSGTGADEILSDYSLIPNQSTFKGKFPNELHIWENFYNSCMYSYLGKEERVAGAHNIETRYPFLDTEFVQEFLYLTPDLKNKFYKNVLHEYLTINNYPFEINKKIGFSA